MKLKVDDEGKVVVSEQGMPVYVYDDGKETEFNAPHAVEMIKKTSDERDTLRKEMAKIQKSMSSFEGIDPEEARKALEVVSNLDQKKLVEAGKIDEIKKGVAEAYTQKIEELTAESVKRISDLEKQLSEKDARVRNLMINSKFATSEALRKTVLTPDVAEAFFGKQFDIIDGNVVGYKRDGDPIYTRDTSSKIGTYAEFDEALAAMIDDYPHKDRILRDVGTSGGEAVGSGRRTQSTIPRRKRSEMKAAEKSEFINQYGIEAFKGLPA